jgi:hypothetical protein
MKKDDFFREFLHKKQFDHWRTWYALSERCKFSTSIVETALFIQARPVSSQQLFFEWRSSVCDNQNRNGLHNVIGTGYLFDSVRAVIG